MSSKGGWQPGLLAQEAMYWGESGDSEEKTTPFTNLAIHHPNEDNNINHFKFTLLQTHNQPLLRQTTESCFINNAKVDMNSKAEWHKLTAGRVVIT